MDAWSRSRMGMLLSLFLLSVLAAEAAPTTANQSDSPDRLVPFASEKELAKYLAKLPKRRGGDNEEIVVTGLRTAESITNTQTEGVDEGGIVKVHGDHLVVLRRGRLFTLSIADGKLEPGYWTNAYADNMDPDGTWYDEMLVHGNRVVVIGYSYERDGTEIALFDIDAAGKLRYDATYHLRSDDYFSSHNYASRLVDGKLVFYSPLPLSDMDSLPAIRRWPRFAPRGRGGFEKEGFSRIVSAQQVFRPVRSAAEPWSVLHTITTCDLDAPEFRCEAVGVIGTYAEVFYVSASAVYVWTGVDETDLGTAIVYRLPLDGSPPTALSAVGMPIDQFSFFEADGYLNVVLGSDSYGNWMWSAEADPGDIALFRVPLSLFGGATNRLDPKHYTSLPLPAEERSLANRFVNGRLLYGFGEGWYGPSGRRSELYVTEIETSTTQSVSLAHSVDRIEVMGAEAVVIGTDAKKNLHFSGIELAQTPRVKQRFMLRDAAQGELRSHGFFYSPNASSDGGMLGLPVRGGGEEGWRHLRDNLAAILFLRNEGSGFDELGLLYGEAESLDDDDDGCEASCVDWYGNARPIFLRGRIYALLGYELVEGKVIKGPKIREVRRINFMPFEP